MKIADVLYPDFTALDLAAVGVPGRRRRDERLDPVVSMVGSGSAGGARGARLLAGNGVPHRWLDIDSDPIGRMLADRPARRRAARRRVRRRLAADRAGRLRRARSPARQTAGRELVTGRPVT